MAAGDGAGAHHQMEVEETNLPTDLVGEQVEFLCTQLSLFPGVLGTEVTVEITGVCDFYVTTINHSLSLSFLFSVLSAFHERLIVSALFQLLVNNDFGS